MSDEENPTTPNEAEEEVNEQPPKPAAEAVVDTTPKPSNKTQKQLIKDSKQRAIDNFNKGIIDPEWRVVKMSNGKFRTYKRKESLAPTPINVNQIKPNKPSKQIIIEEDDEEPMIEKKTKHKAEQHDPMKDSVYYNLNNQINEQLNKRLDSINQEIERLRNKNTKLKNKYRNLKQAIFVTEEEEQHEPTTQPQQQEEQPEQQQQEAPRPTIIPIYQRRRAGIDFNQFF